MVRERTPARRRSKQTLEDSWVVDEEDEESDFTPPPAMSGSNQNKFISKAQRRSPERDIPRKRSSKSARSSAAEPSFIMPSIHAEDSWRDIGEKVEDSGVRRAKDPKTTRHRKEKRSHQRQDSSEPTLQDKVEALLEVAFSFLKPVAQGMLEVLGYAAQVCKKPAGIIIGLYLLSGFIVLLYNILFSSIHSALSPICRIPGVQFLDLPICDGHLPLGGSADDLAPPVQFDQLMSVQNKFEEVLQESASGVNLPLDMKRGETSIRDLRQVVRFSQLRSKNELVLEFDGFIETARIASYDLQKFNSHVGRGVDNVLATARWTKKVLDGIAERDTSRGAIAGFINDRVLAPFQPVRYSEDTLLNQYLQHTQTVEEEINRLVAEAQALLLVLQNLEDRLDVVHGIVIRDNLHVQGSRNEVLSQLWTMLGGNRNKLGKYETQLRLLNQVNTYRQNAIAHVTGTMLKLQSMGAELEELRDRVGGVELLGGRGDVPLRLHIENIEMGVERLERGRMSAKELENEQLQRALSREKTGGNFIDSK